LAGDKEVVIQARPQFEQNDIVPMLFRTNTAGTYTIAVAQLEGVFESSQSIFIRDLSLNVVHEIKASPYTFATEAGVFENRFEILYESMLNVSGPETDTNDVIALNDNGSIAVKSNNLMISAIQIFDVRGRLLAEKSNINSSDSTISAGTANQLLIVKIVLEDGTLVTKKVAR
jgi:hypothetical protein